MLSFLNKPFPLLDKKEDRAFLIVIILIFSILFLNVFKPFNIHRWFSDSPLIQFLRLSSYGLITALVFFFTQFPLRKILKVKRFRVINYIIWLFTEVILISLVYIFLYGNPLGNFINDALFSIKYTLLGICLPYSFAILIIYYKNQRKEINLLKQKILRPYDNQLITFSDENNKIKFSLQINDLLYIESMDNYVAVYHLHDAKIQRTVLRNTLKNLEKYLQSNQIFRCHRSFMVNIRNIEFFEKTNSKFQLKVKAQKMSIPVSQKYSPLFLKILT